MKRWSRSRDARRIATTTAPARGPPPARARARRAPGATVVRSAHFGREARGPPRPSVDRRARPSSATKSAGGREHGFARPTSRAERTRQRRQGEGADPGCRAARRPAGLCAARARARSGSPTPRATASRTTRASGSSTRHRYGDHGTPCNPDQSAPRASASGSMRAPRKLPQEAGRPPNSRGRLAIATIFLVAPGVKCDPTHELEQRHLVRHEQPPTVLRNGRQAGMQACRPERQQEETPRGRDSARAGTRKTPAPHRRRRPRRGTRANVTRRRSRDHGPSPATTSARRSTPAHEHERGPPPRGRRVPSRAAGRNMPLARDHRHGDRRRWRCSSARRGSRVP